MHRYERLSRCAHRHPDRPAAGAADQALRVPADLLARPGHAPGAATGTTSAATRRSSSVKKASRSDAAPATTFCR